MADLPTPDQSKGELTLADLARYCLGLQEFIHHQHGKIRLLHGVLENEREEHARTEALLNLALDYLPDWTVDTRHGRALMRKERP